MAGWLAVTTTIAFMSLRVVPGLQGSAWADGSVKTESLVQTAAVETSDDEPVLQDDGDKTKVKKTKKKDRLDVLTSLGPNKFAGRVRAIVVRADDPATIWAASASGGLWVTRDRGATWSPADDFLETLAFSSLVADPQDPDVMYAGSGEIHMFLHHLNPLGTTVSGIEGLTLRSPRRGGGIFKTTDGGVTWRLLPSTANQDFFYVSRIAVHPRDSNIVLAATNTGVWRSADAGTAWEKVIGFVTPPLAFLDVKFHPSDPENAVATAFDGAIFFSIQGGFRLTWRLSAPPAGLSGTGTNTRVELAPSASQPGVWLAAHMDSDGERITLLRSIDRGARFNFLHGQSEPLSCTPLLGEPTSEAKREASNALYTGALWVHPLDPSRMLVGGLHVCQSTDGGKTFWQVATDTIHNDQHAIAQGPIAVDPILGVVVQTTVYLGNDGGMYRLNQFPTGVFGLPDLVH